MTKSSRTVFISRMGVEPSTLLVTRRQVKGSEVYANLREEIGAFSSFLLTEVYIPGKGVDGNNRVSVGSNAVHEIGLKRCNVQNAAPLTLYDRSSGDRTHSCVPSSNRYTTGGCSRSKFIQDA